MLTPNATRLSCRLRLCSSLDLSYWGAPETARRFARLARELRPTDKVALWTSANNRVIGHVKPAVQSR
jgi:hypothetical protein